MSEEARRTVFLVDPDRTTRSWIEELCQSVNIRLHQFNNGSQFLKEVGASESGCLVCEIRLEGMSGLKLIEEIRQRTMPFVPIVLTGHPDIQSAVESIKSGAVDYFEKTPPAQRFLDAVNQAIDLSQQKLQKINRRVESRAQIDQLTSRELEVLTYIANGYNNQAIAKTLGIRERTIEAHRAAIMRKLDATSIVDVVRLAFLSGMGEELPPPAKKLASAPRRKRKTKAKKTKRRAGRATLV